jgi:hypothetical protein
VRLLLLVLVLAAGPVAAQTAAEKEPRKPLNLDLDDAMRAQPVIRFGPPPAAKEAERGLPSLGSEARKMEPGPADADSRRPFPKDSEMQNR